jgi:hypothetical protein
VSESPISKSLLKFSLYLSANFFLWLFDYIILFLLNLCLPYQIRSSVSSLFGGITEKQIVFALKNLDLRSEKRGIDLFFLEQLSLEESKTAVSKNK